MLFEVWGLHKFSNSQSVEQEVTGSNPSWTNTHSTFTDLFSWDVKEPTSKRVGVVDPSGVVNLYGLWDWVGMAPCMGPESSLCTFPLGRPVPRKAGKAK